MAKKTKHRVSVCVRAIRYSSYPSSSYRDSTVFVVVSTLVIHHNVFQMMKGQKLNYLIRSRILPFHLEKVSLKVLGPTSPLKVA